MFSFLLSNRSSSSSSSCILQFTLTVPFIQASILFKMHYAVAWYLAHATLCIGLFAYTHDRGWSAVLSGRTRGRQGACRRNPLDVDCSHVICLAAGERGTRYRRLQRDVYLPPVAARTSALLALLTLPQQSPPPLLLLPRLLKTPVRRNWPSDYVITPTLTQTAVVLSESRPRDVTTSVRLLRESTSSSVSASFVFGDDRRQRNRSTIDVRATFGRR